MSQVLTCPATTGTGIPTRLQSQPAVVTAACPRRSVRALGAKIQPSRFYNKLHSATFSPQRQNHHPHLQHDQGSTPPRICSPSENRSERGSPPLFLPILVQQHALQPGTALRQPADSTASGDTQLGRRVLQTEGPVQESVASHHHMVAWSSQVRTIKVRRGREHGGFFRPRSWRGWGKGFICCEGAMQML